MLHHANAHDAVEFPAQLGQVAVVHALHAQQIGQALLLNAFVEGGFLFAAQGDARTLYAVFLRGFDQQEAPAAADVQKLHARL